MKSAYEFWHIRTTPVWAALIVAVGPLFGGFDNAFGNATSCALNCTLLIFLLAVSPPPFLFWRRIIPVVAIFLCALLWGWGVSTGSVTMIGLPKPPAFAPDLVSSELSAICAAMAALLAGCLIAFRRQPLGRIIDWLLLFGCVNVLLGLIFAQNDTGMMGGLWGRGKGGRFVGTLGNANVAAAYYGALAVLAGARALSLWRDERVRWAWLHWLALLLCIGACAITASRAPMTITLIGMVAVAAFVLNKPMRRRDLAAALAIAVGIVATVFSTGYADLLLARMDNLQGEGALRVMMWQHYFQLVEASPIYGYGLGSFPDVNRHFLGTVPFAQAMWTVNSPHNIFLQLALNGGLPYVVLATLAGIWIIVTVIWARFRDGWDVMRVGMTVAIGVIGASAMVDIALDIPAMVTFVLFLAGLLWGDALSRNSLILIPRTQRAPTKQESSISR